MAQAPTVPTAREQRLRMSYEEFLAFGEDTTHAEWVDGEVIVFMPPTRLHQTVQGLLFTLLRIYAEEFDLGTVLQAPFEVRLPRSAREPDILFVARRHLDRLSEARLTGPPDLAIEVISPDSVTRDRREKLAEYATVGIPEYWLFDARPGRHRHTFYRRTDRGTYAAVPLDDQGRYHALTLPGFWLRPAWLWQVPQPNALACLLEIAPDILAPQPRRSGGE